MPLASRPSSAELETHVDASDFKRLFDKSSQVDKTLRNNLRREIRNAAKTVAGDAKTTVMQPPLRPSTSGRSRSTGLRAGIAAGIGVSILTGNTRIGVAVTSSGKGLDSARRGLVSAWDSAGGWRHPAWGSGTWVNQVGRPYFYSVIAKHRDTVTTAVQHAMQQAADSLETT